MTVNDSWIRILFELMPVFLASLAFVHCILRIGKEPTSKGKFILILACVNCLPMLSAQISWAWTVYMGNTIGTLLADYTWTIFNSSVMASYLVMTGKK